MHVGDIDVMIDVHIYILSVTMECKKIIILGVFAECHGQGTRQSFFQKNSRNSLPSARAGALGKVFFKKNPEILCRVPGLGHSAKYFFFKNKKNLPSVLIGALGKVIFKKIIKKLCRVPRLGHSAK